MASTSTNNEDPTATNNEDLPVLREISDANSLGEYIGQVKWFGGHRSHHGQNASYNYGFITVCSGELKGRDVFVHHTGIRPLSSRFRLLHKGEYCQFGILQRDGQMQAVNVTGIQGGPLLCDVLPMRRYQSA
jgi:cold shock CspA family protein